MSSTNAGHPRYRWTILGAGVVAQASFSAIFFGLPAIAPVVRTHYSLSLTQVGVVLASLSVGLAATLLLWGIVADRIGERAVLAAGLTGCSGALVAAAYTSSFAGLVIALVAAGALGAGTQTASGRAVMSWFGPEERGLALGIRQTAVPLGGVIAATTLPSLVHHVSLRAAFFALAGGCLVAAIVAAMLVRAEPSLGDEPDPGRPLRDPRIWRLSLGSTFYVTTQSSLLGFLVLFLHDERGVSTTAGAARALGGNGGPAGRRLAVAPPPRPRRRRDVLPVVERTLVHCGRRDRGPRAVGSGDRAPAVFSRGRVDRHADRLRDDRPCELVADGFRPRSAEPARGLRAAQSAS